MTYVSDLYWKYFEKNCLHIAEKRRLKRKLENSRAEKKHRFKNFHLHFCAFFIVLHFSQTDSLEAQETRLTV